MYKEHNNNKEPVTERGNRQWLEMHKRLSSQLDKLDGTGAYRL
eukprot:SAG22_NODE_918_length_6500_cov_4.729105_5_plen_43_part_00